LEGPFEVVLGYKREARMGWVDKTDVEKKETFELSPHSLLREALLRLR